jgi:hypothetical protein
MNRLHLVRAVPRTPVEPDSATTSVVPTIQQLLEQQADPETDVESAAVASIEAARVRRNVRTLPSWSARSSFGASGWPESS